MDDMDKDNLEHLKEQREMEDEMLDDMDDGRIRQETEMRDPAEAMKYIRRVCAVEDQIADEDDEPRMPNVVRVCEVLEVEVKCSFRESGFFLRAKAIRMNGSQEVEDIIEVWQSTYSGSSEEPPDYDAGAVWEGLDEDYDPVNWSLFYGHGYGHLAGTRDDKIKYMYKVLRKHGVKCRVSEGHLQIDIRKRDDAYKALGMHLANLDSYHPIWKEIVR